MANICLFGMKIKGADEKVAEFVEYVKGNKEKELCGIYLDGVDYINVDGSHIMNGGCRHSIYISMLAEDGSYYSRLTDEEKKEFTNLEELSKELDLKIDIDGDLQSESEHVVIEHGRITLYE